MPEDIPSPPQPGTPFHIGEEFGTAKKNLPPVKIVLIGAAIIAPDSRRHQLRTASTICSHRLDRRCSLGRSSRSKSDHGRYQRFIPEQRHQALHDSHHQGRSRHLQTAASAKTPLSPADFDRYFQAFPTLKQHALTPLEREAKIDPGGRTEGTIIVAFPVTPDAFATRKSLKVTIQPYFQPVPLVLTK